MKLNHIALQTLNFEKTLLFYKKLGFNIQKKVVDDNFQKIYRIILNDFVIEVFSPNIFEDDLTKKNGFIHICFNIDIEEKMYIKNNFKVLREQKHGNIEVFFINGINGEEIEFNFLTS